MTHKTEKTDENKRVIMSRLTSLKGQNDRSFDIEFWQRLSDEQRMSAVWEMVVFACQLKGKDLNELRLQRTVENLRARKD